MNNDYIIIHEILIQNHQQNDWNNIFPDIPGSWKQ